MIVHQFSAVLAKLRTQIGPTSKESREVKSLFWASKKCPHCVTEALTANNRKSGYLILTVLGSSFTSLVFMSSEGCSYPDKNYIQCLKKKSLMLTKAIFGLFDQKYSKNSDIGEINNCFYSNIQFSVSHDPSEITLIRW